MATLQEQISQLTNPTPVFKDPEDDINEESVARVVNQCDVDDIIELPESQLQKQTAALLSDYDQRYRGKRISRKRLKGEGAFEKSESDDEETDSDDLSSNEQSDDNSESKYDKNIEENIKSFNFKLKQKETEFVHDGDYNKYGDDETTDEDNEMSDDDDDEMDDKEDEQSDKNNEIKEENDMKSLPGNENLLQNFSKVSIDNELEKGKATKNQLGLWDSMLEIRIKIQKFVTLANQLPQYDIWPTFVKKGDHDFHEILTTGQKTFKHILDKLVELQTNILLQNSETRHIVEGNVYSPKSDDEEIPSDTENEDELNVIKVIKQKKRKLQLCDYPDFLAKRHKAFEDFRNSTIQKWNDRTRLATGKVNSKSFSAFEQSALKQAQQILSDRERVIKRTQLKRSSYRVLGKPEEKIEPSEDHIIISKQDLHLQDYDSEIFDDDDFYHQLLRDLIERRTTDITDPNVLGRQWIQLQKLRKQIKKKVDTKASKGRKIRYDVHSKLVNFMAPFNNSSMTDESKNDLFNSLFGKRWSSNEITPVSN